MKISIPHIHKTLGDIGFWAQISERGEIKELRVQVLEGLRQIEGIIIGRRIFEAPLIISRICGICPTSHILNSCRALEKSLDVKVSLQTEILRKLITAAQIIQSHSAHIFFMSLADFFGIENDMTLIKKFKKESKAALSLRDFALKIIKIVGGRTVHPITPKVGGFSKIPQKQDIKKAADASEKALESALVLAELFKKLDYPFLKRKTLFCSSYSKNEYPYHNAEKIKIGDDLLSIGDFFSNQIEEDLKLPPSKRVKYQGKAYMPGAIARIKNNFKNLDKEAKIHFSDFLKKNKLREEEFYANIFYNTFCQSLEIIHFVKEAQKNLKLLLKKKPEPAYRGFRIKKGSGLAVLEAPRGVLFSYFELDNEGRVSDCNIITPTAQFLSNIEQDLKVLLPQLKGLSSDKKIRRIKTLIRAYDPCIACAVH